jgi:transposase
MAKHIYLNDKERVELEQLIKSGVNSARVIGRARALLLVDRSQGKRKTIQEVAEAAMVSPRTVSYLKRRYFEGGTSGALYDKPRPGAKPKVDGEVEARLIALACSDPPEGYARWTLRLLADELVALEVIESISHVTVREVLKKTNLSLGKSSPGAFLRPRRAS